jgi:hypothetical protein
LRLDETGLCKPGNGGLDQQPVNWAASEIKREKEKKKKESSW